MRVSGAPAGAPLMLTSPSREIVVPSFGKINLSLRVLGRRADGLHEVRTILQTVSLHDTLAFELTKGGRVEIICDDPSIPTDERNLVYKAASLLKESRGADDLVNRGVRVRLVKRTPAGGGLGGGSSNAAVTLVALARLWEIESTTEELARLAARLGADVPFFLYGGTALGTGTGARITPLADAAPLHLVIVTPPVQVPTAIAYQALDAPPLTEEAHAQASAETEAQGFATRTEAARTIAEARQSFLTNEQRTPILIGSRAAQDQLSSRDFDLRNDFEPAIFRLFPQTGIARDLLSRCGARRTLLSGSGASVFGIFSDEDEARRAASEVRASSEASGFRVFECATVNQAAYRASLAAREG